MIETTMRKYVSVLIALSLFVCFFSNALATDIDLSSLSFTDLLELQEKVNTAIFSSGEWKQVEVPLGVWDIGKDIPAGRYELSPGTNANAYNYPYVVYYLERHENGSPDKIRGQYRIKQGERLVIELFEGNVLKIEDTSVIFKRYIPSFSFN